MRAYNKAIIQFNQKCIHLLKNIIGSECNLEVKIKRFLYNAYLWPIEVVSYLDEKIDKSSPLAYFNPNFKKIYINHTICSYLNEAELKNLLRHEFAHYLCFIEFGTSASAHGQEYRNICKNFDWNEDVYLASLDISHILKNLKQDKKVEKKYHKLMELSQSDNIHEAALALEKASKLLLHNKILNDGQSLNKNETYQEPTYFVENLCTFKRMNAKLTAIYHILNEFGFSVCSNYGKNENHFEVSGLKEDLIHAKMVYNFLDKQMDSLWELEKSSLKKLGQSGLRLKNSYFHGFGQGVVTTLKQKQRSYSNIEKQALIKQAQEIQIIQKMVYKSLTSRSSSQRIDSNAQNAGFRSGKKLNMNFKKNKFIDFN